MANGHNAGFTKLANEIRKEAVRQLGGFPRETK